MWDERGWGKSVIPMLGGDENDIFWNRECLAGERQNMTNGENMKVEAERGNAKAWQMGRT